MWVLALDVEPKSKAKVAKEEEEDKDNKHLGDDSFEGGKEDNLVNLSNDDDNHEAGS